MLILIDVDSVVADFDSFIIDKYNETHSPTINSIVKVDGGLLKVHPLQLDNLREGVNEVMCKPGFFADIPIIPGAKDAVYGMLELGHTIYFCTSPKLSNPTCADDKLKWIAEHFDYGLSKKTIITKDKTLVYGDILIDDRINIPGHMEPFWTHVLFNTPYNEHINDDRIHFSWKTWQRDLESVEELLEKRGHKRQRHE